MDWLEEQMAAEWAVRGLPAPDARVLVAFSGGGDSVALARLLLAVREGGTLRGEVALAHLNHGLRGAESDADESFCRNFAQENGLRIVVRRLAPGELAAAAGSLEAAGREARLGWLSEVARSEGFTEVATGHTADDVAETVLMRLLRGCGIRGLAAMRPERSAAPHWPQGRIVRPVLGARRAELRGYLRRCGQGWREDASNADLRHMRNRVRHGLLPAVVSQGGSVEGLTRLNAAAADVREMSGEMS